MRVSIHKKPLISAVLAVSTVIALGACQEEGGRPTLTLEEARRETAEFKGPSFVPPPRTIEDITKILDQQRRVDVVAEKADTTAADRPVPKGLDRGESARFYLDRGRAARRIGRVPQALIDLKKAHALSDALDPDTRHVVLGSLFGVESHAGNMADAISHLNQAVDIVDRNKPMRIVALQTLLARFHARSGDLASAERALSEANDVISGIENGGGRRNGRIWRRWGAAMTSRVKQSRARILEYNGKYREAEKLHRAAIILTDSGEGKIGSRTGNVAQIALNLRSRLARNLLAQGRLIEAEVRFREVLLSALKQRGRYSPFTAQAAAGLTALLNAQGRHVEAEDLARAAVEILEKTGAEAASRAMIKAEMQLAKALISQTRWKDAYAVFNILSRALENDPTEHAHRLGRNPVYALTLLRNGRANDALSVSRSGYEHRAGRMGEKHQITAMAQGVYAMALLETGDRKAALTEFAGAVPILMQHSRRSDDGQKHHRSRITKWIIESYMEALSAAGPVEIRHAGGKNPVATTFRLADFLRGQAVQKALNASAARAAAQDSDLAGLVRQEQDTLSRIGAMNALYARAAGLPSNQQNPKALKALRTSIDRMRGARAALAREIAGRFPDYANLVSSKPGSLGTAQKSLRPGEAIIATYVGETHSFSWAAPHGGRPVLSVVKKSAREISAMVRHLRKALDPAVSRLGNMPEFDIGLSHELYNIILAPVRSGWKDADSLLVVAHGPLGQLPFAVLVTKDAKLGVETKPLFSNYRKVAWLARSHAITVLPSAGSLSTLRGLPAPRKGRRDFVGFGDPIFNSKQAALSDKGEVWTQAMVSRGLSRGVSRGVLKTHGVPLVLRAAPAVRGMGKADISRLPRLKDTADEIKSIATAMNADPARDVFLGRRASESRVKSMDLSNYRVITFATHGLVPGDLDGLDQPALAMTAPEVLGEKGDGLLTMGEILTLKLDADWVVLSACNTATGAGAGAEAVSGLGRAFFYAGTRALLATNWPVETTSARELTTDLFRRQTQNPSTGRARALRATILSLIDNKGRSDDNGRMVFSYAHPIFWAPFSLIGDGGA
jgi:CHAT domain-containing protein